MLAQFAWIRYIAAAPSANWKSCVFAGRRPPRKARRLALHRQGVLGAVRGTVLRRAPSSFCGFAGIPAAGRGALPTTPVHLLQSGQTQAGTPEDSQRRAPEVSPIDRSAALQTRL